MLADVLATACRAFKREVFDQCDRLFFGKQFLHTFQAGRFRVRKHSVCPSSLVLSVYFVVVSRMLIK